MVAYFISIVTHAGPDGRSLECQAKGFLLLKNSKSHACCFPHTHVVSIRGCGEDGELTSARGTGESTPREPGLYVLSKDEN